MSWNTTTVTARKNLSLVFYLLNLLAFVTHLILELGDRLYQKCREQETLPETWQILRTMMRALLFENWQGMLLHFLDGGRASP